MTTKPIARSVRDSIQIIASVAAEWIDVDCPRRMEAEDGTLRAHNRFTREALVFAINQQMSLLTEEALTAWARGLLGQGGASVAVLNPGNIPFVGLRDFLAVVLSGHRYLGTISSRSPVLLPAFADALAQSGLSCPVTFCTLEKALSKSDALIASGSDDTMSSVRVRAENAGIRSSRMLLRGHRYSIAVLDGRESEEERIGLAEDMLLHEGLGCRNVSLVWAPVGVSPDPYLEAMAAFRSSFPAHEESRSSLSMQLSYLKAVDIPHAYSDGLQFIISKGDPEVMVPLHIRWSEYKSLDQVRDWIAARSSELQLIVAPDRLPFKISSELERLQPGQAQRPGLDWRQDGIDLDAFLSGLA